MIIDTDIGSIPDAAKRFFAYCAEREAIRVRREVKMQSRPWTTDPILQKYRFCNVRREDDATTRWFAKYVREPMRSQPEVLLATMLFRWFNRITTGEAIFCRQAIYADDAHSPWEEFLRTGKVGVLRHAIKQYCGAGPYVTGAYIINSCVGVDKLTGVLQQFESFVRDSSWRLRAEHWAGKPIPLEWVCGWLAEHKGMGPFMAYEVVTDLRHTAILENAPDIHTWANAGPGARRGLNRVFGKDYGRDDVVGMRELLKLSRYMWPSQIEGVMQPRWEMREVEHSLCEFDKYERTRLGQGKPNGVLR